MVRMGNLHGNSRKEGENSMPEERERERERERESCLFLGCLTSQQQASVSLGRICSDNCTCCHTETEVADQTISPTVY